MKNLRMYGTAPFNVAVIHGGPGASGEMAPVAKSLSQLCGVLEPLQTKSSIDEQIEELKDVLEQHGNLPTVLIGHSWGAWLSFIFAAKYPALIGKLILVGSGPYEAGYLAEITKTRMSRFTEEEKQQVETLIKSLNDPVIKDQRGIFQEFGKLMSKVDSFHPISLKSEVIEYRPDIYHKVMDEVITLRKSGELLELGKKIECSVIAIHGEYDPHPYRGVKDPLSKVLKHFQFKLLKDCGHSPWNEYYAKERFYEILKDLV